MIFFGLTSITQYKQLLCTYLLFTAVLVGVHPRVKSYRPHELDRLHPGSHEAQRTGGRSRRQAVPCCLRRQLYASENLVLKICFSLKQLHGPDSLALLTICKAMFSGEDSAFNRPKFDVVELVTALVICSRKNMCVANADPDAMGCDTLSLLEATSCVQYVSCSSQMPVSETLIFVAGYYYLMLRDVKTRS